TIEGSLTTMPLPLAYTNVLAVPRSMARSLENMLNSERMLCTREFCEPKPFDDMNELLSILSVVAAVWFFCRIHTRCWIRIRFRRLNRLSGLLKISLR